MKKGNPTWSVIGSGELISRMNLCAPYQNISAAFNFVNGEYPLLHSHTHWEILLLINGQLQNNINGQTKVMSRGDAILIRPQDTHQLLFTETRNSQYLNFICSDSLMRKFFDCYSLYETVLNDPEPKYFFLTDDFLLSVVQQAINAQLYEREQYEFASILLSHSVLLHYLQRFVIPAEKNDYPNWLKKFIRQIQKPANFTRSVQDLAKLTNYSYPRLNNLFQQYTNLTIHQYVMIQKMNFAKRLLQTSDMTTLTISSLLNYDSLSSFNHNFKKTFHMTPTEFRKQQAINMQPVTEESPS